MLICILSNVHLNKKHFLTYNILFKRVIYFFQLIYKTGITSFLLGRINKSIINSCLTVRFINVKGCLLAALIHRTSLLKCYDLLYNFLETLIFLSSVLRYQLNFLVYAKTVYEYYRIQMTFYFLQLNIKIRKQQQSLCFLPQRH